MKWKKNLFLITFLAINIVDEPAPEVTIEQGTLSGKTSSDGSFFEYLGIPYATTNSSTRFRASGPPPSWEGVYKAVEESSSCPQNSFLGVIGSEDCLKINVYVPAVSRKLLPVLVYIHGGAFILGSGGKLMYGPDFILQKEVIVVTFNYRLGLLGFLCLRIKEAPGNAGIKDQIAALRWVKKNIAAFGGDPENITIFGESAGAVSVSFIIKSEAATGLFKRAIIQSGSSLAHWSINRNPIGIAHLLAKSAGYDTKDPEEMYNIFSNMTYQELTALGVNKTVQGFFEAQLIHLPCVESKIPGEEPAITDLPFNILNNKLKDIDVIYGTTSKEGLFIISELANKNVEERNGKPLLSSDLQFPSKDEELLVSKAVQNLYFGNEQVNVKQLLNKSEIWTHLYFEVPTILESEYLLNKTQSKIYNYYFNYSGKRNYLKWATGYKNESGATHGDDIFYLFRGSLLPPVYNSEDKKVLNYMTTLFTNFAKYGNPTPDSKELGIKWEHSSKNNMKFLYIDNELQMGMRPNDKSYRFWRDIYDKYRATE